MSLTPLPEGTPEDAHHGQGLFVVVLKSSWNAPQKNEAAHSRLECWCWGPCRQGLALEMDTPLHHPRNSTPKFPSNSHIGRAEPRVTPHHRHTAVQTLQTPARHVSTATESVITDKIAAVVGFFTFNLIFMSVLHLSAALDLQLKSLKVGTKKATFVWRTVNSVQ